MQQVTTFRSPAVDTELSDLLPLYLASIVVTLAGIAAVGVTISNEGWMPLFSFLAIAGHAVSLLLRLRRAPVEAVFWGVMLIGSALVIQFVAVSEVIRPEFAIGSRSSDMAMAALVGMIATVRCFTLLTDAMLVFSAVPPIAMLALAGSMNPNPEVAVFFGLWLLGSLFLCGYEAHLRRRRRRPATHPAGIHLMGVWAVTLTIACAAALFPLAVQPVLSRLSPLAQDHVQALQGIMSFSQPSSDETRRVGQGPIALSDALVYEVFSPIPGKLRSDVFSHYTGHGWDANRQLPPVDKHSDEESELPPIRQLNSQRAWAFRFPADAQVPPGIPTQTIRQTVVTAGAAAPEGIPGLGPFVTVWYPYQTLYVRPSGCLSGQGHRAPMNRFAADCLVPDYSPDRLRAAGPVEPERLDDPETLVLPQSAYPLDKLAHEITAKATTEYDRVEAVLAYIEKNTTYSLQEEVTPPGEDAAVRYLTVTKYGACDLSATAAAVLCRAVGIPSRIVTGYLAQEPNDTATGFLVRRKHAHMWLEVFFPGFGWVPFDPSPPLASIHEPPTQLLWLRIRTLLGLLGLSGPGPLLLAVVVLGSLATFGYGAMRRVFARWRARYAGAPVTPGGLVCRHYARTAALLTRRGWKREPWMTPREYLDALRGEWRDQSEALSLLEKLTDLFQQARYAGEAAPEDAAAAAALSKEIASVVQPRPRPAKARPPEALADAAA